MLPNTPCLDIRSLLPFAINGTLSPSEEADISAHLAACADCASELEVWQILIAAVRASDAVVEPSAAPLARSLVALHSFLSSRPALVPGPAPLEPEPLQPELREALARQLAQIISARSLLVGSLPGGEDPC
jgi:anti-sigma factor RsiW